MKVLLDFWLCARRPDKRIYEHFLSVWSIFQNFRGERSELILSIFGLFPRNSDQKGVKVLFKFRLFLPGRCEFIARFFAHFLQFEARKERTLLDFWLFSRI